MHICRDPDELLRLLHENARDDWKPTISNAAEWLAEPSNFALVKGNDLGLFEAKDEWPGPLHAHVFFESRGKNAIRIAKQMLAQAFDYGATEILGETPLAYTNALMFARLLGFRVYGEENGLTLSRLDNN